MISTAIWKALDDINVRTAALSSKLNTDYFNSAVTSLQLLVLPSDNAIVSVSITVADPWVPIMLPAPFAPGNPLAGDNQSGASETPKTSKTTVTISKDDRTITIETPVSQAGSTAPPNAPSVIVTPAAKPPVSVQISGASPNTTSPPASGANQNSPSNATAAGANSSTASATTTASQPDTTFLMGRHHILYFIPTGGFLLQKANNPTYAVETVATSVITTTTTVTTPPNNGSPTTVVTSVPSTGTANFAYQSGNQSLQYGAVVGLTFFPRSGRQSPPGNPA